MLKGLRKNNKKGFTLVELIVVLVILAILAALLIPALTGYIDKAKEKQIVAETRQIVMAAQTLVDEEYAKLDVNGTGILFSDDNRPTGSDTPAAKTIYKDDISGLAEVTITKLYSSGTNELAEGDVRITLSTSKPVIEKVEYKAHGLTCTYTETDGAYVVE